MASFKVGESVYLYWCPKPGIIASVDEHGNIDVRVGGASFCVQPEELEHASAAPEST